MLIAPAIFMTDKYIYNHNANFQKWGRADWISHLTHNLPHALKITFFTQLYHVFLFNLTLVVDPIDGCMVEFFWLVILPSCCAVPARSGRSWTPANRHGYDLINVKPMRNTSFVPALCWSTGFHWWNWARAWCTWWPRPSHVHPSYFSQ